MKHPKSQQGFTLVEMLIVIAIIGIISAMAAPSFQQQIANQKVRSTMSQLQTCFKDSQTEALTTRADTHVIITSATGSSKATLRCGNSAVVEVTPGINIKAPSGASDIVFKANRKVYANGQTEPLDNNNPTVYSVCYENYPNANQGLTINNRGVVTTASNGSVSCS